MTAAVAIRLAALLRRYPFRGKSLIWKRVAPSLDGRSLVVTLPGGGVMDIDTSRYWQRQMLAGCYERRSVWAVGRLLEPGDVFVDGGANCGLFACLAAGRVGSSGVVHAFEPDPRLQPQLDRQRSLNQPTLHVHAAALSDAEGERVFHLPAVEPPDGWGLGIATLEDRPGWLEVPVSAVTLDGFLARTSLSSVTLAKLDLEGHEAPALEGARASLESGRIESVLVEINDARVGEVMRRYRFEHIIDVRSGFRPIERPDAVGAAHTDVLFLRGACARRWRRLRRLSWLA